MKQKLHSILLMAVVFLCAASLAFAEGDKVRQQKQKRNGTGCSYQTNLDGSLMLSATQKRQRTRTRDGSCQTSSIASDGAFLLAGNGNGGSGDNGGNGSGGADGDHDCDGTGDGPGPGPGAGNGPGTGDCQA